MKDYLNTQNQPKIVVFEGVRSDESVRREKYSREGKGVKHVGLVNARPIFFWNNTEIYLYIIEQEIDLHPAYKKRLTRVGCNICPFASTWSEYLISKIYPDLVSPYVDVVKDLARGVGLKSEAKILEVNMITPNKNTLLNCLKIYLSKTDIFFKFLLIK